MSELDAVKEIMEQLEKAGFEVCSRYGDGSAALPDPRTICPGQCEGMGWYPQHRDEEGVPAVAWNKAHREGHTLKHAVIALARYREWWFWKSVLKDILTGWWFRCDGWHFIKCEQCGGTGKKPR